MHEVSIVMLIVLGHFAQRFAYNGSSRLAIGTSTEYGASFPPGALQQDYKCPIFTQLSRIVKSAPNERSTTGYWRWFRWPIGGGISPNKQFRNVPILDSQFLLGSSLRNNQAEPRPWSRCRQCIMQHYGHLSKLGGNRS